MAQREQHERVKRMDRWAGKAARAQGGGRGDACRYCDGEWVGDGNIGRRIRWVTFERDATSVERADTGSEDASDDGDPSSDSKRASAASEVYVDVGGAVVTPGVYRLREGARVAQAIDAAGGLTPEADVAGLNRASRVVDGQKIYVPHVGEQQTVSDVAGSGPGEASASASVVSNLVNINTANAAELQTLSGVGPSMAQSIIDERTQNGPFTSIEDLMRVSGIGEKKFAKIKDCICI